MREWITAQGGDVAQVDDTSLFAESDYCMKIKSNTSGYITEMNCEKIGTSATLLGAGRLKKDDKIDLTSGIILAKKTGDYVNFGEEIATLYSNVKEKLNPAAEIFKSALTFGAAPCKEPIIYKTVK